MFHFKGYTTVEMDRRKAFVWSTLCFAARGGWAIFIKYFCLLLLLLTLQINTLNITQLLERLRVRAIIVSIIRKYNNHKLQTNPWRREKEPHNNHETPGRLTKQGNQFSLPHRDDCKIECIQSNAQQNSYRIPQWE